tara:strand:+ start:287 stop:718 length:432 start_codon:yes stop_codon:yes gene_type:complete
MTRIFTRIVLAGSGAILGIIGSFIMSAPRIFLATSEVIVEPDAGLMSEVTAPSGMLVITGLFMMIGAIKLRFANLGLICGAFVYGSYGVSRLISMHLHGTPSETLIVVTYFELGVAVLLLALNLTAPRSSEHEYSAVGRVATQ